jgi:hypothetical protein
MSWFEKSCTLSSPRLVPEQKAALIRLTAAGKIIVHGRRLLKYLIIFVGIMSLEDHESE